MFFAHTYTVMLVTGIILAPAVMATPAVQDLTDLRTVINSAASTIGDLQNPNRGWGLFGSSSQMGTADLINNITSTILQSKFQVDTNKVGLPARYSAFITDARTDCLAEPDKRYDQPSSQHFCTVATNTHSAVDL
jgi:hypothetical protein